MTYPLVIFFDSFTCGGDCFLGMWYMWWVPYSIFDLQQNPYYTNFVYYPSYSDLSTAAGLVPIQGILLSPITNYNPIFSINLFIIIGFTISGLTAFYLAKRLTNNLFASFIAGFIFTFSAVHMAHSSGHWHIHYIAWIPLFILLLFDLKEKPNLKSSILFSIPIILTIYSSDPQILVFLFIFLAFFLIYYLISQRKKILNKKFVSFFFLKHDYFVHVFASSYISNITIYRKRRFLIK